VVGEIDVYKDIEYCHFTRISGMKSKV
jgi:hypothetical protein